MYPHNVLAPEGMIYVCTACGKTSPTKSGWDCNDNFVGQKGWDVSCFLNSSLFTLKELEELRKENHGN